MWMIFDDTGRARRSRRLLGIVAGFWTLHLFYRTFEALVMDRAAILFDRALLLAIPIGVLLSIGLCLLLAKAVRRGLLFGLGAAALLSVPTTAFYASAELAAYLAISPVVNPPHVEGEPPELRTQRVAKADEARRRTEERALAIIVANGTGWYFFFFGLASFFVGVTSARRLQEAERRAAQYEALARESQLKALRHQINPHFLFNTLNSLSSLVMAGASEQAEGMILNLATFYRATLDLDPTALIPLDEELELQRLYLEVEQARFRSRLEYRFVAGEEVRKVPVPALLLQPLVENAVKHGVARSTGIVEIGLFARARGSRLVEIVVQNTRSPAPEAPASRLGVGMKNVRQRLQAAFGSNAAMFSPEVTDDLFRVTVVLPSGQP